MNRTNMNNTNTMNPEYKTEIHNAISQIDKNIFAQTPLNQPKALDQIGRSLGDAINRTGWFKCAADSEQDGHKYRIYANKEKFGDSSDVGSFELENLNGVPTLKMCFSSSGSCATPGVGANPQGGGFVAQKGVNEPQRPGSGNPQRPGNQPNRPGQQQPSQQQQEQQQQQRPGQQKQGPNQKTSGYNDEGYGMSDVEVKDFQIEQLQKNVQPLVSCLEEYFVQACSRHEKMNNA